jgi:hypothetical protein
MQAVDDALHQTKRPRSNLYIIVAGSILAKPWVISLMVGG